MRPDIGPRLPQALQTKRGSMSESLTWSGHPSTGIAIEWLQRWSVQTRMPIVPPHFAECDFLRPHAP
jgi:hypothetical protein